MFTDSLFTLTEYIWAYFYLFCQTNIIISTLNLDTERMAQNLMRTEGMTAETGCQFEHILRWENRRVEFCKKFNPSFMIIITYKLDFILLKVKVMMAKFPS